MTQIVLPEQEAERTSGPTSDLRAEPMDLLDGEQPDRTGGSRFDTVIRRVSGPVQALRAVPHVGTWIGVVLASIGAILLVIAWVRVAALTNVALQIPYIVSAGFTGIGLVAVGLTVINVAAKREDAIERSRQLTDLRELLAQIRETVES